MNNMIQLIEKNQLTTPKNTDFLGDAVAQFLLIKSANLQPKSIKTYNESLNCLVSCFGSDRDTTTITQTELIYFFGGLNRKPSGIFMVWQACKFFFDWFFQHGPEDNPIREIHMKRPKRDPIKGIDTQQVEKILKKITGPTALRDKALISVLFSSALRDTEFCNLKISDINPRTGYIDVRSENAKGRKFRQVCILGTPLKNLNKYLKKIPNPDQDANLWQTRSGEPLTESGIREIVSRSCTAAGLENFSFHDFRRGCALAMKRNGADIKAISHFLGHADLKTTERYLALDDTDNATTAALYSPLK